MAARSVKDLSLSGKKVFIRVDFNVPIKDGKISDDTRIRASLPTIQYAVDQGATVILASHLGRPKGKPSPEYSLRPVAARLAELLGRPVTFAEDSIGRGGRERNREGRARRRGPARELALSRGRREERRRLRAAARRARRRLRQRCVRLGSPRARVHRGHRPSHRRICGRVADGEGGRVPRPRARASRPAVCRHSRRRQGVGQARGDREPDSTRRRVADWRRDGLHLLQGSRRTGRQVARRGRSPRHGARRRTARKRARPAARVTDGSRRSRPSSKRAPRRKRLRSAIRPSASAWDSTSARGRCRVTGR